MTLKSCSDATNSTAMVPSQLNTVSIMKSKRYTGDANIGIFGSCIIARRIEISFVIILRCQYQENNVATSTIESLHQL